MTPERAASVFRELLQTPLGELDQVGRRTGLEGHPTSDDLSHARELLRALVIALKSGPGPNWEPITTAWGAMVTRHGQVQEAAVGPGRPEWIRDVPAKPGLGDPAPGTAGYDQAQEMRERYVPKAGWQQPQPYGAAPAAPPVAAQPMGAYPVAPTTPGAPEPPPPPGRAAWPAPPPTLAYTPPPAAPQQYAQAPPHLSQHAYVQAAGYPPQPYGPPPQVAPAAQAPQAQYFHPPAPQPPAPQPPAPQPPAPQYSASQPSGGQPSAAQAEPQRFVPQRQPPAPRPPPPPQRERPSAPPAQPEPRPAAAASADQGNIEQSVARYAAFCAACAAHPDRVFATMVEYGIQSPEARNQLDQNWQDRFDDDAELHAQWEQLFARFRAQIKR